MENTSNPSELMTGLIAVTLIALLFTRFSASIPPEVLTAAGIGAYARLKRASIGGWALLAYLLPLLGTLAALLVLWRRPCACDGISDSLYGLIRLGIAAALAVGVFGTVQTLKFCTG